MTTGIQVNNNIVSMFIHHMIPHHQNAVNMAKALLNSGTLRSCDDLRDPYDDACVVEVILRSIINNQNYQIQQMRSVLDELSVTDLSSTGHDACILEIQSQIGNVAVPTTNSSLGNNNNATVNNTTGGGTSPVPGGTSSSASTASDLSMVLTTSNNFAWLVIAMGGWIVGLLVF